MGDQGDGDREGEVPNRTFSFPIAIDNHANELPMKYISLPILPTFHGKTLEDPDQFLFEFKVLCQTYDYTCNYQKLKLFPSTMKESALRWFMGLNANSINSWEEMEIIFLNKY